MQNSLIYNEFQEVLCTFLHNPIVEVITNSAAEYAPERDTAGARTSHGCRSPCHNLITHLSGNPINGRL